VISPVTDIASTAVPHGVTGTDLEGECARVGEALHRQRRIAEEDRRELDRRLPRQVAARTRPGRHLINTGVTNATSDHHESHCIALILTSP
jgi:hypothetical protein